MTNIGDLLGNAANELLQLSINVGDVYLLNLDPSNGITPKNNDATRNKYFIVLGFDNEGNVIGNYSAPIEVSPIGMSDHLTVLQQQELHCISNFRSS